jgi:hypothetical protein
MCIKAAHFDSEKYSFKRKTMAKSTSKSGSKKGSSKRELIDTGTDKRYVRRDAKGQFKESDDQGKSLSQDRKRTAKTEVKSGQGDKGDQAKRKTK